MKRRAFMTGSLGTLGLSASNQALVGGLGLLNTMTAQGSASATDHKTLVMVYLNGGVDSLGLLIPTSEAEYTTYKELRQHLATPQPDLISLGDGQYGTPNYCENMVNLYESEKLGWVSNVGPLRYPTTKAMIQSNDKVMPLFVGSHNSQTVLWQSASTNPSAREGWGAKMLDLLNQPATVVSPNISLNRSQLFTSTLAKPTFSINPEVIENLAGLDPLNPGEGLELNLFYAIQEMSRTGILDRELSSRNLQTLDSTAYLKSVLQNIEDAAVPYPHETNAEGTGFQAQLKTAAKLISAAPELDHPRQVIMVQMHAYDTHDNQDRILPVLLRSLFSNLEAFQADLEARGVDDRVVTFSQSDFGRTPTINANGTDHGWGGHNFLMGTPVKGRQIAGAIPEFGVETDKMLYNLSIPDFSVEQYASNLAKWFGLSDSQITEVFPNLSRFDDVDFGLLPSAS